MGYFNVSKDIYKVKAKIEQDYILWNMSPNDNLKVFSTKTNGLIYFELMSRSGIIFKADGDISLQSMGDSSIPVEIAEIIMETPTPAIPINPVPVEKPIINKPSIADTTFKDLKFYLDAGHGGRDPGAVNYNLKLEEKTAALDVVLELGQLLETAGAKVFYSRQNDTYPTISQRAKEANANNANYFISVHLNSADNKSARGVETLCFTEGSPSYRLAREVQECLVEATGFKDRGVKIRPDLGVLRLSNMPAILCEIGFISNDEEALLLFDSEFQEKIAAAIFFGVGTYLRDRG